MFPIFGKVNPPALSLATVPAEELDAFRAWQNSQTSDAQAKQPEAKDAAKTETGEPTASDPATASATGPELDEDGFAVEPVSEGGANVLPPVEVANEEYKGIGGPNGVIPGESRSRLL
jgi:hypothetical protein